MQAIAPTPFRWAYYADVLGDEAGLLCLGWVKFCDAANTVLVGYNMQAEVISLPNDAKVFWARDKETVVSTESVLWNILVCPRAFADKKRVQPGHTPPELDYEDSCKSLHEMPGIVAAQWAKVKSNVLRKAAHEKKRESMYRQSKARREKHKLKQQRSNVLDTPSPISKKQSFTSRRTGKPPAALKALLHAVDLDEVESPIFPDLSKLSVVQ